MPRSPPLQFARIAVRAFVVEFRVSGHKTDAWILFSHIQPLGVVFLGRSFHPVILLSCGYLCRIYRIIGPP